MRNFSALLNTFNEKREQEKKLLESNKNINKKIENNNNINDIEEKNNNINNDKINKLEEN